MCAVTLAQVRSDPPSAAKELYSLEAAEEFRTNLGYYPAWALHLRIVDFALRELEPGEIPTPQEHAMSPKSAAMLGYHPGHPRALGYLSIEPADKIREEEAAYLRLLERKLPLATELISNYEAEVISGADAFRWKDQEGIDLELIEDIALDYGKQVDRAEFDRLLQAQREKSRGASKFGKNVF